MDKGDIKKAFISSLPVMAGYLALGFGFGVLLRLKGFGIIWAVCMSATIYSGSLQYIGVDLLASGASLLNTAITTLTVNARYLFYGISLIDKYKGAGLKKIYLMFALTDETYSLTSSDESIKGVKDPQAYYFLLSFLNQCYWIAGGVLGSLAGKMLNFNSEGVDFVLTALFVTIFIGQWLDNREHRPAIAGVASSVICLLIFGSENFLIPAMICIAATLILMRGKLDKDEAVAQTPGGETDGGEEKSDE